MEETNNIISLKMKETYNIISLKMKETYNIISLKMEETNNIVCLKMKETYIISLKIEETNNIISLKFQTHTTNLEKMPSKYKWNEVNANEYHENKCLFIMKIRMTECKTRNNIEKNK